MQRAATWVFIVASVAFGIIGSLFFVTLVNGDVESTVSQAVVLASFGVSVAGKYLTMTDDESKP